MQHGPGTLAAVAIGVFYARMKIKLDSMYGCCILDTYQPRTEQDEMTIFNIEKAVTVDAEVENGCKARIAHLWDAEGNCLQDKLGVARWANVKAACEFLMKDDKAISATTECGVTVYRGKA